MMEWLKCWWGPLLGLVALAVMGAVVLWHEVGPGSVERGCAWRRRGFLHDCAERQPVTTCADNFRVIYPECNKP